MKRQGCLYGYEDEASQDPRVNVISVSYGADVTGLNVSFLATNILGSRNCQNYLNMQTHKTNNPLIN